MRPLSSCTLLAVALAHGAAAAPTCLATCANNADCGGDISVQCGTCFSVSPNPGKCASGCNVACADDSQCLDPNCGVCSQGKCSQHKVLGCLEACTSDAECNAGSKNGTCTQCISGKCGAKCGQKCTDSSQCLGDSCNTCNDVGQCISTGPLPPTPRPPGPPAPTPPPVPKPTTLLGVSYGPVPMKTNGNVRNSDMMTVWFDRQWAPNSAGDRGDLSIIKGLGAGHVRMYGNDARQSHTVFLNQLQAQGLKLIAGNGNQFRYKQKGSCFTGSFDCYDTIKKTYAGNLKLGFLKPRCDFTDGVDYRGKNDGGPTLAATSDEECCALCVADSKCLAGVYLNTTSQCYLKYGMSDKVSAPGVRTCTVRSDRVGVYHDALDIFSIANEPDLAATAGDLAKALLSALDAVITAEQEAGVEANPSLKLTVTFSFATCATCASVKDGTIRNDVPSVPFMTDLYRAVQDPSSVGYTPRNAASKIQAVFAARWVNSFNLAAPAHVVRDLFLSNYVKVPVVGSTPVFIAEYHQAELTNTTNPTLESDLAAALSLIKDPNQPLFGMSFFQYQVAYDKATPFELQFGMFALGDRVIGKTRCVGDPNDGTGAPCVVYDVYCLQDSGRGLPEAVQTVFKGDGTWQKSSGLC
eukprot:TRINITY_DN32419_c0_g1_i1.p1 TRINITY_DN32419_c0_g1~~TRINITY_DN32419_c0_g1_i1.p1  ORF type:complete len:637 (+),score=211.27 TRINITY_DN32419_c0_g1_i1:59-1969(+)